LEKDRRASSQTTETYRGGSEGVQENNAQTTICTHRNHICRCMSAFTQATGIYVSLPPL